MLPLVMIRGKLQEIFVYGADNINITEINADEKITFYAVLDGWFKELQIQIMIGTAFDNSDENIYIRLYRYRQEFMLEGNLTNINNYHDTGVFSAEEVFATTNSRELTPWMLPSVKLANQHMYFKAHIAKYVEKNSVWTINVGGNEEIDGTVNTAGAIQMSWQLKFIIAPNSFRPGNEDLEPLVISCLASLSDNPQSYWNMTLPSAGYMSNAKMQITNIEPASAPFFFIISPNIDQDFKDNVAVTDGSIKNFAPGNSYHVLLNDFNVHTIFFSWGNQRVYVQKADTLFFLISRNSQTDISQFYFSSDFIPHKGSEFIQVLRESTIDAGTDFTQGFYFPIDLEGVTVTYSGSVTALSGHAILAFRLFSPYGQLKNSISGQQGDTDTGALGGAGSQETTMNDSGFVDMIAINEKTPNVKSTMFIPFVRAGSFLGLDTLWDGGASGTFFWVVKGKVAKQKFSKSSEYLDGTGMLNVTPHIRRTNMVVV